ncbi:hypothetical protein [Microbispora sitophila]
MPLAFSGHTIASFSATRVPSSRSSRQVWHGVVAPSLAVQASTEA